MRKSKIINGIIEIIKEKSEELGLTVEDLGTGHAFDKTFWKGIAKDNSNIPNVIASKDGYKIELRSFWGCPELSIRRNINKKGRSDQELLILQYSDYAHKPVTNANALKELDVCETILSKGLVEVKNVTACNVDWFSDKDYNFYKGVIAFNGKEIETDKTLIKIKSALAKEVNILYYFLCTSDAPEKDELIDYIIKSSQITKLTHTGNYMVSEVRVDGDDYEGMIEEIYSLIDKISA